MYIPAVLRLPTTFPMASSTLDAIAATLFRIATSVQSPVCGCCHEPQVALGEIGSNFSFMISGGAWTYALSPEWQPWNARYKNIGCVGLVLPWSTIHSPAILAKRSDEY
jgi:hypothetical protein